jgi:hypothetical protein
MARFSSGARAALLIAVFGAMALAPHAALAQPSITTQATLLDRIQIEDLLIAYYQPLGPGSGADMAQFYTEDGVLDLNNRVYQGKPGIRQAYKDAATAAGPSFKGKFHMLMSNPQIVVHGENATADLIWTGIASETVKAAPHLVEQGREHDELVKQDGRWLLKKRIITSDGGIPDFYAQTYKDR